MRFNTRLLAIFWTLVLSISFLSGKFQQDKHVIDLALTKANTHFRKDLLTRKWAAGQGGIYVEVSDRTQPNPYLSHIPNRDLDLPSGMKLTLMNPAYMMRQLNEDMVHKGGAHSKITSLNPLRPQNGPDSWEHQALRKLEAGEQEVFEIVGTGQEEQLRLMRPMYVVEQCLKCHGHQGYQIGDLHGGMVVTVPLKAGRALTRETVILQLGIHLGLWGAGLIGIFLSGKVLEKGVRDQSRMASQLQQANNSTHAIIENVPFGIIIVGKDKIVRLANRTALEILGKPEDEVVGRICHENICPAQVDKCPVLDENQQLDNSRRVALGPDNREIPILKTVIPFISHGEEVLLEAFVDTSKQEKQNEDLVATMNDMQRFNNLAVGRELRMAELKAEVNTLLEELERRPRYARQESTVSGGDR